MNNSCLDKPRRSEHRLGNPPGFVLFTGSPSAPPLSPSQEGMSTFAQPGARATALVSVLHRRNGVASAQQPFDLPREVDGSVFRQVYNHIVFRQTLPSVLEDRFPSAAAQLHSGGFSTQCREAMADYYPFWNPPLLSPGQTPHYLKP